MTDTGLVLTVWGQTDAGRHLIVTLRRGSKPYDWWIGPAEEMDADEVAEFQRWEARRDQH